MQRRSRLILARIAIATGVVLVTTAIAAVALVIYAVRHPYPETSGQLKLPGLQAPVTVYRDEYAIPQVYGESEHDLFMAQGYIHAQERFWQMDFWRHIGAGRLSEMFGDSQLDTDRFLRTLGWARVVAEEVAVLDPESRAALEAYAAGVNAYLAEHAENSSVSVEYSVLDLTNGDYEIEPWKPEHSLTWAKVMAWDLSGNLEQELERAILLNTLSRERVDELFPPYPDDHPYIVSQMHPSLAEADAVGGASSPALAARPGESTLRTILSRFAALDDTLVGMREGIGSNSWAVSGDLTSTGGPLLANDPHLGVQMPSIWFEIGLHQTTAAAAGDGGPLDVTGFSFAGVPGVVIGHNARIAWGFTNVGADVQDLYIERINPEDPDQYEVNGEWVDMRKVDETIVVAGAEPVEMTVRYTRHGPVVSDSWEALNDFGRPEGLDAPMPDDLAVSLRWTALEPTNTLRAVRKMNKAADFASFREAARDWDVPSQNLLYADTAGNIGYQMPGRIPLRPHPSPSSAAPEYNDGRYPVPGWTDEYEWEGYVPFERLPYAYDPPQGYIVTANNAVAHVPMDPTPDGRGYTQEPSVRESTPFPDLVTYDWHYGYRAQRIVDLIASADGPLSATDMRDIQADAYNLNAETLLPALMALDVSEQRVADARGLFDGWDLQQTEDSAAGALFEAFWVHLLEDTFGDDMPADMGPRGGSRWFEVVRRIIDEPESDWWDDSSTPDVSETRDDILDQALTEAVDELEESLGSDPADWRWGDLHTVTFRNQSLGESGVGIIERLFNRGPYPVAGSTSVVNACNWNAREPYEIVSSPSMRMIVDLTDLNSSLAANTTGQSGHAFNEHYTDMIDMWRAVEHHPMLWDRSDIEAAAVDTLVFVP
jgi:penicillin amidase